MVNKKRSRKKPQKDRILDNENMLERTALELYRDEIRDIKILTREEEVEIGRRKDEAWKKIQGLEKKKNISYNQTRQLVRAKENYFRARNELITRNLRLVKYIANNFRNAYKLTPEEYEDIIQYGNEGVIEAAHRFDKEKGCKFSTHSTWWIRQAMHKALLFPGMIRNEKHVPAYLMKLKRKVPFYERKFKELNCEKPTKDELIDFIYGITHTNKKILSAVLDVQLYNTSLYHKLKQDDPSFLIDLIENKTSRTENDILNKIEIEKKSERLDYYLSKLPRQEEHVLRFRNFFLNEEVCNSYGKTKKEILEIILTRSSKNILKEKVAKNYLTLEETGKLIGVTRERIRQLEEKALNKMRTFMLFDKDFESDSLELKKQIISLFPGFEDSVENLDEKETKESIYKIITHSNLNKNNKGKGNKKGNRLNKKVKYLEDKLDEYIEFLPNQRDKDIMRLIYNVGDSDLRKRYNLFGLLNLCEIAPVLGISSQNISHIKNRCEEMLDYVHWGVKPCKNVFRTRQKVIDKYKQLAEEAISNIEDKIDIEILKLIYGLDKKSMQEKYNVEQNKLTRKEIAGLLGVKFTHIDYRDSRAFGQLWENIKLISHVESYN